ncbi:MAG: M20/M25/M40 family metallo-hydrolase [Defluviitaleaceae bacterium]|nr:M20/M25/M40 family metallo-hydrolase [Defluviitaleaceae bacterium]
MDSIKMIKELTCAFGAPGFEEDVLEVAKRYVPSGYKTTRDSLLNFYIESENAKNPNLPTLLLDAHSDEIGLMVQAVKNDGTLVFTTLGAWVPAALYAQRVLIKNRDGKQITGVIASKMPHFGGNKDTLPSIDKMVIDIGAASKDEVINDFKIGPGCPITPKSEFEQIGDTMIAKAFDDRIGCAAVLEVMQKLSGSALGVNVVGALSSQEEVGLRGAKVVANYVKPDIAICFEGAPADDTLVEPHMIQTAMGKGPMIRLMDVSMIVNPRFFRLCVDIAKKHKIPVQEAVRTGGGTNGAVYHLSGIGVPAIVISCPVRYAHSHNSMASVKDYENTVVLAVEIAKALTAEIIAQF